ncbi:dTDP-4-dehydrorhamnose 3,5-epimerase family protein [Mycolicibacterium goodii]|uniref:dTDP-4-dehydrorhamnose 3,5-epimerase n=1 Tax=Mycolicibacterium goodii TaxID=134601 RepID=A0ABS6HJ99_MYCGD|nr:dTDP-4-dehydrorhamnose 3,5-epimerase [Mycolicibacterium goodii]OKH73734.1 dTDP-4-dehydrorhamnose 3,5-epimerase [Mycobacterium sp. SWH-M5]MBU8809334.1 dTDP-4-dehydrorhamnose 3,5-epimerase [Mycolicibacterium goodii]MBU8816541.1 dTDP-4-dehydrorhamnose 3,5-epimerase [Mycolicibacterium goodii]MBU8821769.1 dTDP-4-dehydrorhamnose 3,5-epimerase [Mycolicibacterium goodii]MBU8831655.1 dTDP-4-dehydrorhamnose 3,5-epimerase [Mycolicibacterium goodii]
MTARELSIAGAWEITPVLRGDSRGLFFEWFTEAGFAEFAGHRLDIRQANCSVSAAGVLRGVHFAEVPPSQAKYVTCVRGAVYDVVVDIRVGSPTFGRWDAVLLDDRDRRSIYIAEGLGHAFLALEDDSTVMYLCSAPYAPQREHTVCPTGLGIEWPEVPGVPELILSDRDAAAPSLAEAQAAGLLPTWEDSQAFVESLRQNVLS